MTLVQADTNTKLRGLLRLTRWQEFLPYYIPLTVFGAVLAVRNFGGTLDGRLIIVLIANILIGAYAFMINDIEDAPDDAREAARAARNPVACGEISAREGWIASGLIAAASLGMFALLGTNVFAVGALNLALSHFYSWKPVRLKAYPVTDIVSHSLMLSGLLFLAGYFTYHNTPGGVWLVALAMTLVSVYGQLYNQVRDFEMDKAAKLHNTAIMVGKNAAQVMMYGFVIAAGILLIISFATGVIPLWALIVPLVALPVFFFVRPKQDSRGTEAVDITGRMQIQTIILYNLTVGALLIATILRLG